MSIIEELELRFDPKGNVIPAEHFSGNGKKNYIAQIMGRDVKYTWRRTWLNKVMSSPGVFSRYKASSFIVGEVYDIHASFLPTPVEESEMQKKGKFDKEKWRKDRMNRINSKYNGFWKVTHVLTDRIMLTRMHEGDMNMRFSRDSSGGDDYQTSITQFFGDDKEEHIL